MKKTTTLIAVASMLLTSVFAFTSCQKDELPTTKNSSTNTNNKKDDGNNSQAVYVTVTSTTSDKGTVDVNALLGKKDKQ